MSKMFAKIAWPACVYYDGACPLCSREIGHYRGLRHEDRLVFVDISAPDFNPAVHGLSLSQFMQRMQVKDAAGVFHSGVDGFQIIWTALPGRRYQLLGSVVSWPVIRGLVSLAYRVFAANRHRLTGRKDCNSESCKID